MDYIIASSVQTFKSGSVQGDSKCLNITLIDNNRFQRISNFRVILSSEVLKQDVISEILIRNNEGALHYYFCFCFSNTYCIDALVFAPEMISFPENKGRMKVCATLKTSLPLHWPISIVLDANDNTGIF